MRIAVVGTLWHNTPPKNYGGTERIVYDLVNGLTKNGHDVTFFGPGSAKVNANIVATVEQPLREIDVPWEDITYTLYHLSQAFDHAEMFDIVHVHLNKAQDYIALPFSVYKNTPTLFTPHFVIPDEKLKPDRFRILQKYRQLPFSSISKDQQKSYLNFVATTYNGIALTDYPYNPHPQDYFVWLGKIAPFKGTREAILAAKKAGKTLLVLGVIERGVKKNLQYYEEEVKPLIDSEQIIFHEAVGLPKKAEFLANAKALINPIQWKEPFGLVMAESLATGTPVIAYKQGASPELVIPGKTGFLVKTVDEIVEAMKKIDTINRQDCRTFIASHFTVDDMVKGYENAYNTVITNWPEYYKRQTRKPRG